MSDFERSPKTPLTLIRQSLLPGFGAGRFEPGPVYDEAEFKASFPEESGRRDSRISIRVSGKDLGELQKLALEEGIPTQTLIANIVHQYVQALAPETPEAPQPLPAERADEPGESKAPERPAR